MSANLTNLAAIVQENYEIKLQEALNNKVLALQIMKKKTTGWNGKQIVIPVHVARNTGGGYSDAGTIGTPSNQGYVDLIVKSKRLYQPFAVDGMLMSAAPNGGSHAFVAALASEMKGASQDAMVRADQVVFSGGRVMGFINQRKIEGAAAQWEYSGDAQKLKDAIATKGSAVTVQVIQLDTYAVLATKTVTAVDVPNLLITVGAALDTQTTVAPGFGCAIKVTDADASLAFLDSEPTGIYGNMADPNHFTVDRSFGGGAEKLQANIRTANPTGTQAKVDISLPLFETAYDIIDEASGMEPDLCLVHYGQRQKYVAIMQATIHTVVTGTATKEFNGGAKNRTPAYGELELKAERFCGKGLALFLASDSWRLCQYEEFKILNKDGLTIRQIAGSDIWSGAWAWYYQTVCLTPDYNAVIHGLT